MRQSRKLLAPIISAAIATISFTSFATVILVRREVGLSGELFASIWPITLTTAVAIVLVMSVLYKTLLEVFRDLQASEAAAKHTALHDQLTGLPNRALLHDRIEQAIVRRRRAGEGAAVLMLDLDRFKQVNDTLGHQAGDALVQSVGERLVELLRETDTVARIGGDEFAIVMTVSRSVCDIHRLCERIIDALTEPFPIHGREARVGVSIGAVQISDDDVEPSDLLRRADITMYQAKAAGRGCFRIFCADMDAAVHRRDRIEMDLRSALSSEEGIDLHYQPQMSAEGRLVGFECLFRWEHRLLGSLPPAEVIPIAEESGLIEKLGGFVFRTACRAARQWPDLSFAVNLSPLQFRSADLPQRLVSIAGEEGVQCRQIELEITENLLIEHGDSCSEAIGELRRFGFRVALDDFGTGYSSLSYLRHFRVDKIKLDRSFIDTAHAQESVAIIRAAVHLGHAMNLEVVAEGISARDQEEVALKAGCTGLQGYLYAPPMPLAELGEWVRQHRRPKAA